MVSYLLNLCRPLPQALILVLILVLRGPSLNILDGTLICLLLVMGFSAWGHKSHCVDTEEQPRASMDLGSRSSLLKVNTVSPGESIGVNTVSPGESIGVNTVSPGESIGVNTDLTESLLCVDTLRTQRVVLEQRIRAQDQSWSLYERLESNINGLQSLIQEAEAKGKSYSIIRWGGLSHKAPGEALTHLEPIRQFIRRHKTLDHGQDGRQTLKILESQWRRNISLLAQSLALEQTRRRVMDLMVQKVLKHSSYGPDHALKDLVHSKELCINDFRNHMDRLCGFYNSNYNERGLGLFVGTGVDQLYQLQQEKLSLLGFDSVKELSNHLRNRDYWKVLHEEPYEELTKEVLEGVHGIAQRIDCMVGQGSLVRCKGLDTLAREQMISSCCRATLTHVARLSFLCIRCETHDQMRRFMEGAWRKPVQGQSLLDLYWTDFLEYHCTGAPLGQDQGVYLERSATKLLSGQTVTTGATVKHAREPYVPITRMLQGSSFLAMDLPLSTMEYHLDTPGSSSTKGPGPQGSVFMGGLVGQDQILKQMLMDLYRVGLRGSYVFGNLSCKRLFQTLKSALQKSFQVTLRMDYEEVPMVLHTGTDQFPWVSLKD